MRPELHVDLTAITENYRTLRSAFSGRACAAVVKANAYGLGIERVASALAASGAEHFFVATLEEGVQLRKILPTALIGVFHGPYEGEEPEYIAHRLTPVVNHPEQLTRWVASPHPYILHVDTGINRLGFTLAELREHLETLGMQPPQLLMSHLACANDARDEKNAEQLARFVEARALLPNVATSLCNSSGIFLDGAFHHDLARPGCALYGINPVSSKNPMRGVVRLSAPILHIRTIDRTDTVGYGATYSVRVNDRIAIVQMGYADGFSRILSSKGRVFIGGTEARVAGRVSMDMICVDVSHLPESMLETAREVEIIGTHQSVNDFARASATIGYEVLTSLGSRVARVYE